jgi:hypothetical protein
LPLACACREQLKDRQRFIVVSLGQRLLVLLPTPDGELLLLLPRDAENTDDLVQEVVQSVMRVSGALRSRAWHGPAWRLFLAGGSASDDLVQEVVQPVM